MLDVAVLVPFEIQPASWVDPIVRAAFAPTRLIAIRARDRLVELLGVKTESEATRVAHRSLTAVALATSLERAGLRWRALDPGAISLGDWRKRLEDLRVSRPRVVAVSSTFVVDGYWLGGLCELVRRILPESRLAVGGYYYATDAKQFLSLDADVFCVGEGERRLVHIVEAVRDGSGLERIPGLYLRGPEGKLRYTGDAEPLSLDDLPLPDWSLSSRIEPPVDLEREAVDYSVESQRGCIFKCEFCTFRTLAAPVHASVEQAVRVIRNVPGEGGGTIFLVDGTGTSPRERWKRILGRLAERGGSPLPMSVYARVSDLDDEVCSLMAKAGVANVRIGQESGDQRLLNEMRKGTRVDQIAPAVASLGRHGIAAFMNFFYGFPGENAESLAATRRLLRTINDGHREAPVVQAISIGLFDSLNFAAVRQRDGHKDVHHRFGWDELAVPPARAAEAALETYLELSRIPDAPCTTFGLGELWGLFDAPRALREPFAFFRWAKAVDRGIGLLVAEDMEGTPPKADALRRVRDEILAGIPAGHPRLGGVRKIRMQAAHRMKWRLLEEWATPRQSVGPLTRLALGWEVARAMGRFGDSYRAMRSGGFPSVGFISASRDDDGRDRAARQLIDLGIATGRRRLAKAG